ncbi:type VI secretion system contractile sheath small subunit [Teredinibacter franksiae]|uniref:type VI secretion system contractile sheath small subunit n=1 Tax=Teredinibacter franksiae TaxID=2761453 RepID=UPI0016278F86|nr:type VI secretion system contractile sheath small subunit [Teredinibacter franksiae]
MSIQDTLPKSRLTLRYRTEINGEPEDIELPLRILIAGGFSGKNTTKKSFDERKILSFDGKNLNSIMEKMKIRLKVSDSEDKIHTIPIHNVDSFLPNHVIKSIKTMDDMVKSKNLLNSLLSSINNSSKFRNALTQLLEDKASLDSLKTLMAPSYEKRSILPEHLRTESAA